MWPGDAPPGPKRGTGAFKHLTLERCRAFEGSLKVLTRAKAASLRSLCGSFLSRKDAHLPAFGQKRQCPLRHDEESVREPDQEIDVHDRPDNHAVNPVNRTMRRSASAYVRPAIARSPLSQYQNGAGGRFPATRRRIRAATYLPA
jgi:hypothetical protein